MSEYEADGKMLRLGMSIDYNRGTVTVIDFPGAEPRVYGPETPEARAALAILWPVVRYAPEQTAEPAERTIAHINRETRTVTYSPVKRQGNE